MKLWFISFVVALGIVMPSFAMAQTSTTGLLNVYVQVLNQNNVTSYTPSNFTVLVSGQSPSITSFPGSQSGTLVTLNPGSYGVLVSPNSQYNFSASYSVGCNSTIAAGQTQTCVVTLSPSSTYNPYPTPYPYPYVLPALKCSTGSQTVSVGQPVSFTAHSGAGGTYNWSTSERNYPNAGPVLTIAFQSSGLQVVTVTNAAQTTSCSVTVSNSYYPGLTNPITYPTYTSYAYPSLPNTGFGSSASSAGVAFALVFLAAAFLAASPYVRKAFAAATR